MPYFIPPTETFIVPDHAQGLISVFIDVEGVLEVDGIIEEVD